MLYKYIVRNVANLHGKTVTLCEAALRRNGSGMHTHQSIGIWKAFVAGDGYAELSALALNYIVDC